MNKTNFNKANDSYSLEQDLLNDFPHYKEYLTNKGCDYFGLVTFILHGLVSYFIYCSEQGKTDEIIGILSWIEKKYNNGTQDEKGIIASGILDDFYYDVSFRHKMSPFIPRRLNEIIKDL
ncbi:hypothetical protein KBC86_00215 [Candidatus Gracilibacteria bacterium]|nr:hypothetical protein [Candidatus Gracilibacteria bacterium]